MKTQRQVFATMLAVLLASAAFAGEEDSPPSRNPFNRPAFVVALRQPAAEPFAAAPAAPELRATLVAEGRRLANINGKILAPGDRYDGYLILRIEEGRAVLRKDGQRITLDVYEQQTPSSATNE